MLLITKKGPSSGVRKRDGNNICWHKPILAKAVRTVYLRNAVIFQYNRLEAEQPPTQTSFSPSRTVCLVLSGGPTSVNVDVNLLSRQSHINCGVEVTELSTNKQHTLSHRPNKAGMNEVDGGRGFDIYTYMHTYVYTYIRIKHVHTYYNRCTYTHTYIHTCIHSYIPTYIHIQMMMPFICSCRNKK
jgi:hypothetical protein